MSRSFLKSRALMLAAILAIACSASPPIAPGSHTAADEAGTSDPIWDDFWSARGVSPAPPRNFLDDGSKQPEILNLTNGALTDEMVKKWGTADLRRRAGVFWAVRYLRLDLVNADVFGPPGLNGIDRGIESERAKGAVEVDCRQRAEIVAAGVLAVSDEVKRIGHIHPTEFLVVETFRMTGKACRSLLANGPTTLTYCGPPHCPPPGGLSWRLSADEFRDDPVTGAHWYETREWNCQATASVADDDICELLRQHLPRSN